MKFTTGEIISAGTGKLCCSMDRVYAIYNYLTGDNLFTHQLPRAYRACEAHVRKACPWLDKINADECNAENWQAWLAGVVSLYGDTHELQQMPHGEWFKRNPVEEAAEVMGGADKVVVVGA